MEDYLLQLVQLSSEIHAAENIERLNSLYQRQSQYGHPQPYYDFGIAFLLRGDRNSAREAFLKGAAFGRNFPCREYDSVLVDAVGQCLAHLLTQFELDNVESAEKGIALAYLYLSRCIELVPGQAHDSYKTRAILLNTQKLAILIESIIMKYAGLGILREPFVIADYYHAATSPGSPHLNLLKNAERVHAYLGDMTIGGKDADEYSLPAMAEFGDRRHAALFKSIERHYQAGALDLTVAQIEGIVS